MAVAEGCLDATQWHSYMCELRAVEESSIIWCYCRGSTDRVVFDGCETSCDVSANVHQVSKRTPRRIAGASHVLIGDCYQKGKPPRSRGAILPDPTCHYLLVHPMDAGNSGYVNLSLPDGPYELPRLKGAQPQTLLALFHFAQDPTESNQPPLSITLKLCTYISRDGIQSWERATSTGPRPSAVSTWGGC